MERTAPESAAGCRTPMFTARCRFRPETPHHIQQHGDPLQHAADDKG
jgi:hypothetical protein